MSSAVNFWTGIPDHNDVTLAISSESTRIGLHIKSDCKFCGSKLQDAKPHLCEMTT